MNAPVFFAAASANANKAELPYLWGQATPEAKVIIFCLLVFSITAWTVMIGKAVQMRRAKKLRTTPYAASTPISIGATADAYEAIAEMLKDGSL